MADRIRRVLLAAIVLPVLFLAMSSFARAATLTVMNTNDTGAGSLRAQILAASSGDTINFNVSGTIALGSSLPAIAINLAIDGTGQSITVDGANSFQVFSVNSGATLSLANLTIAHGNEQSIPEGEAGGGIENLGTLTVTNCTFSNNTAGLAGGAIANLGTLTLTNSTFSGNIAETSGGGIDNVGVLTVTNSTFSGNRAGLTKGGGISSDSAASAKVKGTILAGSGVSGNCSGTITDAGYNISDDNTCGFSGTSLNNSTTLHLDPTGLQNNSGPTKTIALEPNSQAIDFIPVASCTDQSTPTPMQLTTDQRGLPRPDPGNPEFCDAGAFELQTVPFVLVPNSERLQIARSANPNSDQINTAFTFIENGFPACDAAEDAFNGFFFIVESGTCATPDHLSILFFLNPWVVHTVNHVSYGTLFSSFPPGSLSARMVELPTPAAPACGEWTLNLEIAGIDSTPLGDWPFSLILSNADGDTGCFDITNAIVGNQIPTPGHKLRRGARR